MSGGALVQKNTWKLLASNDPHPAKNILFDYGFNILFNYFVVISVYVYICIYVYICVYICTCTHMYMYMLGLAWLRAQPRKWKTICFTVFSAANVSKTSVLSTLRSKTLINCVQFHTFCKTCSTFTENPCAKMQKTKKSEKSTCFSREKCWVCCFL